MGHDTECENLQHHQHQNRFVSNFHPQTMGCGGALKSRIEARQFVRPKVYDPVILSRKSSGRRSRISAGSRS